MTGVSRSLRHFGIIVPVQVKTQTDELQNYLTDASNMQGGHAAKLYIPESVSELSQSLKEADEKKTPVTISGVRTGTVGGAVPFGGYVISLEKLNKIKSIDKDSGTAIVECGVILADLQKAVEAEGLFYPPDPTEWSCQIGGTVATNASGARSFKYGATREYVERIRAVLADGDILELCRGTVVADANGAIAIETENGRRINVIAPTYDRPNVRKNVSGYYNARPLDAIDLFIGSEGTLGVITEVDLKLLPVPEGFFSGIVFFPDDADLLRFVNKVRELSFAADRSDNFAATVIEYFDSRSLQFISEKFPETPGEMAGAIFFEQETTPATEDDLFERWNALLERHNADIDRSWFTTTEQDRDKTAAIQACATHRRKRTNCTKRPAKGRHRYGCPDRKLFVIPAILQRHSRRERPRLCDLWPYRRWAFAREHASERWYRG